MPDRARLERLVDGDSHTIAVLPLTADDVLEVHRVASLIAGGWGAAQAVVTANRSEVLLATTAPADLGIGVVIHADDVDVLSRESASPEALPVTAQPDPRRIGVVVRTLGEHHPIRHSPMWTAPVHWTGSAPGSPATEGSRRPEVRVARARLQRRSTRGMRCTDPARPPVTPRERFQDPPSRGSTDPRITR